MKAMTSSLRSRSPTKSPPSQLGVTVKTKNAPRRRNLYSHLIFSVRAAKQLHHYTMRFLSVSVKTHPHLAPISSLPIWCHHAQVDFQFACDIDLAGSNLLQNKDLFTMKIELMTHENHQPSLIAVASLPEKGRHYKPDRTNAIIICNRTELSLRNPSNGKIVGYITVSALLGTPDHRKIIEPSLQFLETTFDQLALQPINKIENEEAHQEWKQEARDNDWISPQEAARLWKRLALQHGWRSPEPPAMVIETSTIFDVEPVEKEAVDLISFSSDDEITPTKNESSTQVHQSENEEETHDSTVELFVKFALAAKYSIVHQEQYSVNIKSHTLASTETLFDIKPESDPDTDIDSEIHKLIQDAEISILSPVRGRNSKSPQIPRRTTHQTTPPGSRKNEEIKTSPSFDRLLKSNHIINDLDDGIDAALNDSDE